jgi:hypothetical protein
MNALSRYVVNTAQVKTGLSTGVLIGYAAQTALGLATAILFLITVFFVFSDWLDFGATKTSIGMFVLFALLLRCRPASGWNSRRDLQQLEAI